MAVFQRMVLSGVKIGLGDRAKQWLCGSARANQPAIEREGRNSLFLSLSEALQPIVERHGAHEWLDRADQNAMAAVRKIEPRAAAGRQHAEASAKTAQPLHPRRTRQRQPARQLRD